MKKQRKTKQRQLILDAVRARCDHPSADEIYLDVRAIDSKISRGTVYRNLNILVKQGKIHHVKLPHKDRYESNNRLHYHFVCSVCGLIADAPLPYFEDLDEKIAKESGFIINRHRIIFDGVCTDCQCKESET